MLCAVKVHFVVHMWWFSGMSWSVCSCVMVFASFSRSFLSCSGSVISQQLHLAFGVGLFVFSNIILSSLSGMCHIVVGALKKCVCAHVKTPLGSV